MDQLQSLQQDIQTIKERNAKVEADKARETSWVRKGMIAILTYIVVVLFFFTMKLNNPFVNAIVPTMGFLLSTLSIDVMKKIRMQKTQSTKV